MRLRSLFSSVLISLLVTGGVAAQTPTSEPASTSQPSNGISLPITPATEVQATNQPTLATAQAVTAEELGVPERPNFLNVLIAQVGKIFSFGAAAKTRATERIARVHFQQARIAFAEGNGDGAGELIDRFAQDLDDVNQAVSSSAASVLAPSELTELERARMLQASVLDTMARTVAGSLQQKFIRERAHILNHMAKLLMKEDISASELQKKLDDLGSVLAEKETTVEQKFAERLAAADLLGQALQAEPDAQALNDAIEQEFEAIEAEIVRQPEQDLENIVAELPGATTKNLVVLQGLADRLTGAPQQTVQKALDEQIVLQRQRIAANKVSVDQLVDTSSAGQLAVKQKVLARLQESPNDNVAKAVEKAQKTLKKADEKVRQRATKREDHRDGEQRKTEQSTSQPTATSQSSSTASPTSSPTASSGAKTEQSTASPKSSDSSSGTKTSDSSPKSEPKSYTIELSKDGFKITGITIAVGDSLVFEIEDEGSYRVSSPDLSDLKSSTVSKGAKYTYKFTKAGTFKYLDDLHSGASGTVTVK